MTIITFHTITGSVYEVDEDQKLARRVSGLLDPTPRMGDDGVWQPYEEISSIRVGRCVLIVWQGIEGTLTSPVIMRDPEEEFDLTFLGDGSLMRVHDQRQCEGHDIPCCIHNPSDHHMRAWPMHWRSDTRVMERTCCHGVGHPDPDHMSYVLSLTPPHECPAVMSLLIQDADAEECQYPHLEWQGVHGCDGCCRG